MADQHPFGYEERFKFTGKERDSETNYDYFGARFYASLFGFWLSVDPLSDKYPNISPYAYCNWNPIKFVDPDGTNGKDIVMGIFTGIVTNVLPTISLSSIRDSYTPENSADYNRALQKVDDLAFYTGTILTLSGAADISCGTGLAEAGVAISATGIAAPEGGVILAAGGTVTATGMVKGVIGTSLCANAMNNISKGYNRGKQKSSCNGNFSNSRKMTNSEIAKYFGDNNWHKGKYKERLIHHYKKELKGSTNVDLYIDKSTKEVYLRGNKSNAWVKTGDIL